VAVRAHELRYLPLDGLRGIAVLLVFCVHAAGNAAKVALGINFETASFLALDGAGERALFWLFRSHHGVFLFFVLSGFLIGRMWWPRIAMPYAQFVWRRTLRIYPAFLVAFVASLLFAWHSATWQPPDVARVAANLIFLNGAPSSHVAAFNIVTWSLFYEMTFYLAFPLLLFLARSAVTVAIAGIVAPVVAVLAGADVLVLCWLLLFCGVLLASSERGLRAWIARLPSAVVLTLYFAITTAAMLDALPVSFAILAFGAAALAVIAKSLEPGNIIARVLALSPLRALGRVSYSFYLVHWMIVVLVARAVDGALTPLAATLVIFAAGFTLSAIAATISWWIAERPYFAWVAKA